MKARLERLARRVMQAGPESPILDVGFGSGWVAALLAKDHEIEGCEKNYMLVEKARHIHPGIRFFCHDFEESTYHEKYSTVIMTEVIEHIRDYNSFLKNISQSLRPNGRIILTTPNVLGLKNRLDFIRGKGALFDQIEHIRYFTPETITRALKRNGFKEVEVRTYSTKSWLPKNLKGNMMVVARRDA
jgi:2-polyprenyl-3-methyl-5-hydroxy-6-metoxy-1,4-benzoquinol methylase